MVSLGCGVVLARVVENVKNSRTSAADALKATLS